MLGSRSLVDAPNNKPAVIVLREIAERKVRLQQGWSIIDVDRPASEDLPPDQRDG